MSVLQNWESAGKEILHEPMRGQITMEEAISLSKEGLQYFSDNGILSAADLPGEEDNVKAYLGQNLPPYQSAFLGTIYSYWTLMFTNDRRMLELRVNAVSGKIMKADLMLSTDFMEIKSGKEDSVRALQTFVSYLGFDVDTLESQWALPEGPRALRMNLKDSHISAVIQTSAGTAKKEPMGRLQLYLTQVPIHPDDAYITTD
jgi:hypothetical protein